MNKKQTKIIFEKQKQTNKNNNNETYTNIHTEPPKHDFTFGC